MKFLQLTLLAAVFQLSQQAEVLSRIINGTPVHPFDQSYQVKVLTHFYNHTSDSNSTRHCTGSLISNRHILTARHCVEIVKSGISYETEFIQVSLGSTDWREGLLIDCRSCWDISADHRYHPGNLIGDIAVIILPVVVPMGPNINIIELPTWSDAYLDITGKTAVVSGWGGTNDGLPPYQFLNKLEAVIVSQETCNNQCLSQGIRYNNEVFICSIPEYSSIFPGDSGGPVEIDGKLFGINSWIASTKFAKNKINAATKVTHYLWWIAEVTGIKIKSQ